MSTGSRQHELLEKARAYLIEKMRSPFLNKASVLFYLNSWDPTSLGNACLKRRISLERSSVWFFFRFCKNVLSARNYTRMMLYGEPASDHNENYDTLLVSWCKYSDFDENGFYHDRYFNSKADHHKNVLWLLVSIDNRIPLSFQPNVRIYARSNVSLIQGLLFVCRNIWKKILKAKGNFSQVIYAVSAENVFGEKMAATGRELNEAYLFRSVIQPYEAQPFQHALNMELKQGAHPVKTIGYLHSVLPPLPTDLVYREGAPDIVYVHGKGQMDIMQRLLDWQPHTLRFTPSLRFKKNISESFSGWIFLPYNFSEIETILDGLESYFETSKGVLPKMTIRCHPAKSGSKKHILLMNEIEIILKKNQDRFDQQSEKQISFFIGATAAIIEAVERSVEVIHITSDPVFESHQETIWKDLEVVKINANVYQYKLREQGSYIQLGEDQDITQMIA